jgi:hypothetical protein
MKQRNVITLAALAGLLALCLSAAPEPKLSAVPLEVGVDERVELMSIIFRLAGNPEYTQGRVPSYVQDIDRHFAAVREHPVVVLARELRSTRGVSFDAPMSLAAHLKDVESLAVRVPLDPWPAGLDQRWRPPELRDFLEKARQFAREANFGEFWRAHQKLYEETAARARRLVETQGHLDWFNQFFGARPGARFRLAPGLVNGGCCYGARVELGQGEELYCILGVWNCDTDGQPRFERDVLDTIAHEFCHAYVNPHIYARTAELKAAGTRLFAEAQARMRRMAYGNWETMLHESVVRAAVVRYLEATQGHEAAGRQVRQEIERGFPWMEELSQLLAEYETRREQYPTFAAFMPRIVELFNRTAAKMPAPPAPTLAKSGFPARTAESRQLRGQPRELAQDDGQPASKRSLGGNGHAVGFEAPGDNWFLTAFRIHGSRYGSEEPPAEDFHVWLCDAEFKVIADFPFPYARFERGAEQWVTFAVKPTQAPARFIIGVSFNPTATKGVYVSYDGQGGGHSFAGLPGQPLNVFKDGNWLIRATVDQVVEGDSR